MFNKNIYRHNSTNRIDFKSYGNHRPDVLIRRQAMLRSDGLKKEFIFNHHGNAYDNGMISWYDTDYNHRATGLPETRQWDHNTLSWAPEKSDFPLQGRPTNWGLKEAMQEKWALEKLLERQGGTVYNTDYLPTEKEALVKYRPACPKEYSTSLYKPNHVNKDIILRGKGICSMPEKMPALPPINSYRSRSGPSTLNPPKHNAANDLIAAL
jgi:hypothetical protein